MNAYAIPAPMSLIINIIHTTAQTESLRLPTHPFINDYVGILSLQGKPFLRTECAQHEVRLSDLETLEE
jgi:hypothetical protein